MLVRLMCMLTIIVMLIGCGNFENQITKVVSPDEVVVTEVFCITLLSFPVFCIIDRDRTITVRVETIVTDIIEIIVEVEVIEEVIIEKIVTEIETVYVSTETDINEIVTVVVERVKELVPEEDIKDVPLNEIVEEVTKDILDEAPTDESDVTS